MIYWFYTQSNQQKAISTEHQPQEYMSQLHVTTYDDAGNLKQKLEAKYWEFVHEHGYSDLINPQVTVYKEDGETWYITAKHAVAWHPTINDKVSQVDMLDGVVVERPQQGNLEPIVMRTNELQYLPSEELISTDELVTLEQPGLYISGRGLSGYLGRNWIELHDKVSTIYTPR